MQFRFSLGKFNFHDRRTSRPCRCPKRYQRISGGLQARHPTRRGRSRDLAYRPRLEGTGPELLLQLPPVVPRLRRHLRRRPRHGRRAGRLRHRIHPPRAPGHARRLAGRRRRRAPWPGAGGRTAGRAHRPAVDELGVDVSSRPPSPPATPHPTGCSPPSPSGTRRPSSARCSSTQGCSRSRATSRRCCTASARSSHQPARSTDAPRAARPPCRSGRAGPGTTPVTPPATAQPPRLPDPFRHSSPRSML